MNDLEFIRDEVQVERDQLRIDREALDKRIADMKVLTVEVGTEATTEMVEVGVETDRNVVTLGSNVRVISIGNSSDGEEVSLVSFGQRNLEQASQLTVTAESQSECVYAS